MKILKYFELLKENKELKELNEEKRSIAILDNRTNYKLRKEIERLNNIINELDKLISIKLIREANEEDYHIDINDIVEIKTKLLELKGVDKE